MTFELQLRVLGCDGGISSEHRAPAFLVDGRLALDAGGLASGLSLDEQARLEAVLVTHSHLDHVGELGALVELRGEQGGPALRVAGLAATLEALRVHVFNDVLWPDFTRLPSRSAPALELVPLEPERIVAIAGFDVRAVPVHHGIPSAGYVVERGGAAIAYSGDTGPTERFWEIAREIDGLRAVLTEVSFPDRLGELARRSHHLTPASLALELDKLGERPAVRVLLFGRKPLHAREIADELGALARPELRLVRVGERLAL